MPKKIMLMGLFVGVTPSADALDGLRTLGIREDAMSVMSGVPHSSKMLGRPHIHERVPWVSLLGALAGLIIGFLLTFATQWHYPIRVGGRAFTAIPTSIVIIYECTMLGLIVSTFLNMAWKNGFPSTKPQYYDPKINSDRISILCECDSNMETKVREVMNLHGAEQVYEPERRPL
jgi:hypothetical protein